MSFWISEQVKLTWFLSHRYFVFLSKGFSLIHQPGIRQFVFIPLLINLVTLIYGTYYAFKQISERYEALHSSEYAWVQWIVSYLDWLIWPIIVIVVLIVVFYLFAMLANWIAAPFNGLLSEAVERYLKGDEYQDSLFNWRTFISDIPRLLVREWRKLAYFIPRAIACLILFWLPPFTIIAPIVWFAFNAWMAAIQYIDYPMDNHRQPFDHTLQVIKQKRSGPFGFGAFVMLLTMIPVVNLIVMPAAVAGATNLWFDHYQE